MTSEIFTLSDFDPGYYAELMQKPPARLTFVIYFTPRSGSSWLSDVLAQTRSLGPVHEAFNPNFIPNIARTCRVGDLDSYIEILGRRLNRRGVYSFEITYHQLHRVFGDEQNFLRHYAACPSFWLIRRDIVAQAVSLAKMVHTGLGHSTQASPETRDAAERGFVYDHKMIGSWLEHILQAERGCEAMFARQGLTPLRMAYEDITRLGAERMVAVVSGHIGQRVAPPTASASPAGSLHVKLGTAQNDDYTLRFRNEAPDLIAGIEAERAPWLAGLADLDRL